MSPDELPVLVEKVRTIIDPDEDSFFIIRQCGACWADMMTLGQAHPLQPQLYWAAL